MITTRQIQSRLISLGFTVGPSGADGVMGRNTIAAIKKFQTANGLDPDGIVGPKTLAKMWPRENPPAAAMPPWMAEANRYMGLDEVKDAKVLDKLLNMETSEIPWCGAFVGFVISSTLPTQPIPANPLWALNWANWGVQDVTVTGNPHFGAVAVFRRPSGGHVGFVVGHDTATVHVLGGNQSNKVSITRVEKSRLKAYRWPSVVGFIGSPLGYSTFTGAISKNEA